MNKRFLNLIIFSSIANVGFSQQVSLDSVFTKEGLIVAEVKEVTPEVVKFTYPSESVMNSIYRNTIEKIVFKSGRVQVFRETQALGEINSAFDYEKVSITHVESEIKGLYKLDEVFSKAVGTTTLSNITAVKERAFRKLKIQAALLGGNVLYMIDQNTVGNQYGGYYQSGKATETTLTGIVYSNSIPKIEEVTTNLNKQKIYKVISSYFAGNNSTEVEGSSYIPDTFTMDNFYQENGFVYINGNTEGVKNTVFKVVSFKNNQMILYWKDKKNAYNLTLELEK